MAISAATLLSASVVTIALLSVFIPYMSISLRLIAPTLFRDFSAATTHAAGLAASGKCTFEHPEQLLACEDMHLVGNSLFTACLSDYRNRIAVLAPGLVAARNVTEQQEKEEGEVPGDRIFRWDLEQDKVVELELRGVPGGTTAKDRSYHGMDINSLPNGTLTLYIVNHLPSGSVIDKFSHEPSSTHLTFLARVPSTYETHGAQHPNDIFALPELDHLNAFYVTSWLHYKSGPLRDFEQIARRPWSSLHYHSTETGWKTVLKGIAGANGLAGDKIPVSPTPPAASTQDVDEDAAAAEAEGEGAKAKEAVKEEGKAKRHLYMSELFAGRINVLDISPSPSQPSSGDAAHIQFINVNLLTDNPSLSANGDLISTGLANVRAYPAHVADPDKPGQPGAGFVVKRVNTRQLGKGFYGEGFTADPIVEEVVVDYEGRLMNASTTAVWREVLVEGEDEEVLVEEGEEGDEGKEEEEQEEGEEEGGENKTSRKHTKKPRGELFVTGLTSRGILRCRNMS